MGERVDRAAGVQQRGLRGRPFKGDRLQPGVVACGPRGAVLEANAVTQQQLREPVTRAHQVHPHRLTRADQVPQRLLLSARNTHRMQLPGQQQSHQQLGVATVGLDAVPGRPGDLARRRDDTLNATPGELARQPVPGRPRLIRDLHRTGQPRTEPRRGGILAAHHERLQLPGLAVQHRRDDLRRVHVQADEGSSLRHGWFLLFGCGAPRGWSRATCTSPHQLRGGTGPFYTAGRTNTQSILSRAAGARRGSRRTRPGGGAQPPWRAIRHP